MKTLIRSTIILVVLAVASLAQPTQSIVFVTVNPVGSCSNNAALRMNYLTGDISACVNGSWSVINSASGSGNPGGATGSIQYKINASTFGGAASITSGGAISTPSTLSVGVGGSIAGAVDFSQGTLPSLGTTAVTLYAPTSVTSYEIGFPSSAATGFLLGTATGTNVPLTFVGFLGSGSVLRGSVTGGGSQCAQFDNSGVLSGTGAACGAGSGTLSYQGSATATALLVAFDTTHIQTPSATTTLDSGGNVSTQGGLSVGVGGSAAGRLSLTQGTAPSVGTTNVTLYAPTSVTSYTLRLPGVAATGFVLGTASGVDVVASFVSFTGAGPVLRASVAGGGNQCAQFDNSGVLSGTGSACGSGGGGLAYQGTPTATAVVTAFDTSHVQTPSATTTLDGSGNFSTPGGASYGVGGTAAGFISLTQGTAPSVGTTNVTIYAPTSVTSYTLRLPGTAATGFVLGTASGVDVVSSFVSFTGTGPVLRASVSGGGTQCAQFDNSGVLSGTGSTCGSGGGGLAYQGTPTTTAIVTAYDTSHVQTPSATATLDSSGNFSSPGGATFGAGGSTAGNIGFVQGTAPSTGTTDVTLYAPASVTSYTLRLPGSAASGVLLGTASGSDVVLSFAAAVVTIASGTVSLGTTTVNSGTCSSAIDGGTATGVAATDTIAATANADPTAVTGYTPATTGTLYVWAYPTTNHVNFKLCNNTSSNITPGSAVTLNWKVTR